jgi:hypothetical protein
MKKFLEKYGWIFVILSLVGLVAGSITAGKYYTGGNRHQEKYTFSNGVSVHEWELPLGTDSYSTYKQLMLHPAPNEDNTPPFWSREEIPEGRELRPSLVYKVGRSQVSDYYFAVSGKQVKQYIVTWKNGEACFADHCGFAEVLGYQFVSSQVVYPKREEYTTERWAVTYPRRFFLVSGPVFWARTNELGPNKVVVYHGVKKSGPYAEVSSFMMVEGKPVFTARTTELRDTGTRKETLNEYYFVHDFKRIRVDCSVFAPPAPPKPVPPMDPEGKDEAKPPTPVTQPAPQKFVAVVKPFNSQLCGRDVKVGLDRLVEKSVEGGREVTVETLYYSFDGKRFPIPAEVESPRNVVTPPNRRVAL